MAFFHDRDYRQLAAQSAGAAGGFTAQVKSRM